MSGCSFETNAKLFILSGPSGVGKTTLCDQLLRHIGSQKLQRVITYTTRSPRPGEKDGLDYHFIDIDRFSQMVLGGEFLEYARVHSGNYYGSLRVDVERLLFRGVNVLLIIDPTGMKNVINQKLPLEIVSIFVSPGSLDELRRRIIGRGTESSRDIAVRIRTAFYELRQASIYDHIIESGTPSDDFRELLKIVSNHIR